MSVVHVRVINVLVGKKVGSLTESMLLSMLQAANMRILREYFLPFN